MSYVVLDIETQQSLREVHGNRSQLRIAVAILWENATATLRVFDEDQVENCVTALMKSSVVVGFNLIGFDLPILQTYSDRSLSQLTLFDIFHEVRMRTGRRVSLAAICHTTLHAKRRASGRSALRSWRRGQKEAVRRHCARDVLLTRDLYRYIREHGFVLVGRPESPKRVVLEIPTS